MQNITICLVEIIFLYSVTKSSEICGDDTIGRFINLQSFLPLQTHTNAQQYFINWMLNIALTLPVSALHLPRLELPHI